MLRVSPSAVIGAGRVGRAISRMTQPPCLLYGRNMVIPRDLKGPIWVCTTNDGLDDVLQRVDPSQHSQLIFTQNGMLLPFLQLHGLQHNTQVLLYMGASEDGYVTDGGRTAVCGPWSQHVQQLLQQGGVSCRIIDSWEDYSSAMVIKLLWSSIFWLLSTSLGGVPVGQIVEQHSSAVSSLVDELLPLAHSYISNSSSSGGSPAQQGQHVHTDAAEAAVAEVEQLEQQGCGQPSNSCCSSSNKGSFMLQDPAAVLQELNLYSLAIAAAVPSAEMARREFAWRNGWFLVRQATQQHVDWLQRAGCQDLLRAYGVT